MKGFNISFCFGRAEFHTKKQDKILFLQGIFLAKLLHQTYNILAYFLDCRAIRMCGEPSYGSFKWQIAYYNR